MNYGTCPQRNYIRPLFFQFILREQAMELNLSKKLNNYNYLKKKKKLSQKAKEKK